MVSELEPDELVVSELEPDELAVELEPKPAASAKDPALATALVALLMRSEPASTLLPALDTAFIMACIPPATLLAPATAADAAMLATAAAAPAAVNSAPAPAVDNPCDAPILEPLTSPPKRGGILFVKTYKIRVQTATTAISLTSPALMAFE